MTSFLSKDSNDTIIKKFVDCSEKISSFICEYVVTESEEKSEEKFSSNERSFYYNGFNYAYHKDQKTWAEARSFCEDKGEDWFLAEIKSQYVLDYIIDEYVDRGNNFWLGAKKDDLSIAKGCGNYSSNPYRWQSDDTLMSNTNDVFKTKLDMDQKPEKLCCLTISPRYKTGKFVNEITDHKNYKNDTVDQVSMAMDLIIKNMYDAARCDNTKEFLCQQKAVYHPFCLDCGNHHQMELLPDENTDGDGHGKKVCIKKNCICENGIAVENQYCSFEGENKCEVNSCIDNHHFNPTTFACEKNNCFCEGGITDHTKCIEDGQTVCKSGSCSPFHYEVDTEITNYLNNETVKSARCDISLEEIHARLTAGAVSQCVEADCLSITILWENDETKNDLNLFVITPNGNYIHWGQLEHDGGVLEHDALQYTDNPIENIIFEHGAPAGNYGILVQNSYADHIGHKDFILTLRMPGENILQTYAFQIYPGEVYELASFNVDGPSFKSLQKNRPEFKINRNFILENDELKKKMKKAVLIEN